MPCWVAIALLMESTNGWRHTDFTGRHPKTIRSPHRSITSAKAVRDSIVSPRARSRWRFPCVASGSDRSQFGPARSNRRGTCYQNSNIRAGGMEGAIILGLTALDLLGAMVVVDRAVV